MTDAPAQNEHAAMMREIHSDALYLDGQDEPEYQDSLSDEFWIASKAALFLAALLWGVLIGLTLWLLGAF